MLDATVDREWRQSLWEQKVRLAAIHQLSKTVENVLGQVEPDQHLLRRRFLSIAAERFVADRAFDPAALLLSRAVAESRQSEGRAAKGWQAAQAGALLLSGGSPVHAIPFFRRAARVYQAIDDPQLVFQCRNDLANALAGAERYDAAIREHEVCLAIGHRLRDRVMLAHPLVAAISDTVLGLMRSGRGRVDRRTTAIARKVRAAAGTTIGSVIEGLLTVTAQAAREASARGNRTPARDA